MAERDPVDSFYLKNLNRFCSLMNLAYWIYQANPLNADIGLPISPVDVLEVLSSIRRQQVSYLIVDGLAGVFYGHKDKPAFELMDKIYSYKQSQYPCFFKASSGKRFKVELFRRSTSI